MKTLNFLLTLLFLAGVPDAVAEESEYVTAVRTFADNVLQYGKDVYGPKHTPLFVDGINVDTHQPPEWKKDGETSILSNMAHRLIFPLPLRRQRPNLRQQRHIQPDNAIRGYVKFDRSSFNLDIPTGYVFSGRRHDVPFKHLRGTAILAVVARASSPCSSNPLPISSSTKHVPRETGNPESANG